MLRKVKADGQKVRDFIINKIWIGDEIEYMRERHKNVLADLEDIIKDSNDIRETIKGYRTCMFKDGIMPNSETFLFWVKDLHGRYIFASDKFQKIVLKNTLFPVGLDDDFIKEHLQDDNLLQEIKESELDDDYKVQSWVTKDKTLRLLVLKIKNTKNETVGYVGFGEELTNYLAAMVNNDKDELLGSLNVKE